MGNPRVLFKVPIPVPTKNLYLLNGYGFSGGSTCMDPGATPNPYPQEYPPVFCLLYLTNVDGTSIDMHGAFVR
jgi:hypothetical protein